MNTLNSKTNKSNRFIYQFNDKLNLKNRNKNMVLANLSTYYTWKNNNNKFKISAPTWNDEFSLPDGSYSVSRIINKRNNAIIRKLKEVIDENKDGEIVPRSETVIV